MVERPRDPRHPCCRPSGIGNLIAAPLQGMARRDGATVFLDLGTLEPHEDQWAYLSSLQRMSPREVERLARQVGAVKVGRAVERLQVPSATRTRPRPPAVVRAVLGAGVSVERGDRRDGSRAVTLPRDQMFEPYRSFRLIDAAALGGTLVVAFSWDDGRDDGTVFVMPLDSWISMSATSSQ